MSIFLAAWDIGNRMYSLSLKREKLPAVPQNPHVFYQEVLTGLAKNRQYRAILHKGFNLKNEGDLEVFQQALVRIQKECPREYNEYIESLKNKGESLDSLEEVENHFANYINRGCCSGIASSLFQKIYEKQCNSLLEGTNALQYEDIFFRQLLERIRPVLPPQEYPFKNEYIGKNHLYCTFPESKPFCSNSPSSIYRIALKKLALQFPDTQDFAGVILLPTHVMTFQYGPQGHFLYDSYSQYLGLFSYPDEETFFETVRGHVRAVDTLQHLKHMKMEYPNSTQEERLQRLEKTQSSFLVVTLAIRPLDQISPFPCEEAEDAAAAL